MEKLETLRIIFECVDLYEANLRDTSLLVISANNSFNKTFAIEILFKHPNFMREQLLLHQTLFIPGL